MILIFKNRYAAMARCKELRDWHVKIVRYGEGFAVQCNGNKYLMHDGYVSLPYR